MSKCTIQVCTYSRTNRMFTLYSMLLVQFTFLSSTSKMYHKIFVKIIYISKNETEPWISTF